MYSQMFILALFLQTTKMFPTVCMQQKVLKESFKSFSEKCLWHFKIKTSEISNKYHFDDFQCQMQWSIYEYTYIIDKRENCSEAFMNIIIGIKIGNALFYVKSFARIESDWMFRSLTFVVVVFF